MTLLGFTVGAVGPGNYPWWFIVYMLLLHTVCETGFGALFCYFTLPVGVTTKRPRAGAPVRDYIPEFVVARSLLVLHIVLTVCGGVGVGVCMSACLLFPRQEWHRHRFGLGPPTPAAVHVSTGCARPFQVRRVGS